MFQLVKLIFANSFGAREYEGTLLIWSDFGPISGSRDNSGGPPVLSYAHLWTPPAHAHNYGPLSTEVTW